MIKWIIERNIFSEKCFDLMIKHFIDNGIPYEIVTVIPFSHELDGRVPVVDDKCVIYGSIGTQLLAIKYGWKPGVWTNDQFNENIVTEMLGDLSLNNNSAYVKLSEVPIWLGGNDVDEFFIKPNTDTKEFAGEIQHRDSFMIWYNNMMDIGYLDNDDFDVMISLPKKLGMEWRLVIIDGKVCECSIYKQYQIVKPERQMNQEVIAFAENCTEIHNPADVFVMDITQTDDGLKVIEYNTFNSAGLYACDVGNIIDGINKFLQEPC